MNRRKKIIQKLLKKAKQAQVKKQPKKKNIYISKADRSLEEAPPPEKVSQDNEVE
jgi:hypothetical protein